MDLLKFVDPCNFDYLFFINDFSFPSYYYYNVILHIMFLKVFWDIFVFQINLYFFSYHSTIQYFYLGKRTEPYFLFF